MNKIIGSFFLVLGLTSLTTVGWAEEKKTRIRYRQGKTIDFEKLLIQGQLRRPEISVVTGNTRGDTDGLLRLRKNFLDRTSSDIGEEVVR